MSVSESPIKSEYNLQFSTDGDHFTCTEALPEFICKDCGFRSLQERLFDIHDCRLTKTSKIYSCQKCNNFLTHSLLVMTKHVNENCKVKKEKNTNSNVVTLLQCPYCPQKSKRRRLLKLHLRSKHTIHTDSDYYKCPDCNFKSIYNCNLRRHMMTVHEKVHQLEKEEHYYCEHCSFKTLYNPALKEHVNRKHRASREWLQCEKCMFKTRWKSTLQQHTKSKHSSPDMVWLQCDFCDYRAKIRKHLTRHMRTTHTNPKDIKWFRCDLCDYRGKLREYLMRHKGRRHGDKGS